jgi:phosphoglucomutase
MKFYLFAQEPAKSAADLPAAKAKARSTLDALKALIDADARKRAES